MLRTVTMTANYHYVLLIQTRDHGYCIPDGHNLVVDYITVGVADISEEECMRVP